MRSPPPSLIPRQAYEVALEEATPTRENYRDLAKADGYLVVYALSSPIGVRGPL